MKVFVSWSGKLSEKIASLLREYLPLLNSDIEPFVSSHDIESGSIWLHKMISELNATNYGIICFTPSNLQSPWMLFEAGAISKLHNSSVCGLLIGGLYINDIPAPLSMFQNRLFEKNDFKKLISDINDKCTKPLDSKQFDRSFNTFWPSIDEEYKKILADFSVEIKNSLSYLANKQNTGFFVRSYRNPLNDSDFLNDLVYYLKTAKEIKLVGICLVVFQKTEYINILLERTKNHEVEVMLCLGDPTSKPVLNRKQTEYKGLTNTGKGQSTSVEDIICMSSRIKEQDRCLELRLFDYYLEFATMIFDNDIFVYPYGYELPGTESPVFHFRNNGSDEAKFFIKSANRAIEKSFPIDAFIKKQAIEIN